MEPNKCMICGELISDNNTDGIGKANIAKFRQIYLGKRKNKTEE
jgi:hypothetical protein